MIKFIISGFLLFVSVMTQAQKTFHFAVDSNRTIEPFNILQLKDGNFILAASASRFNMAIESYPDWHYVLKFTPDGNIIWENYYDLEYYARGKIIETKFGYSIVYVEENGNVCNGIGLNYPYSKIGIRGIFDTGVESFSDDLSVRCSAEIINHYKYKDKNYFVTTHRNFASSNPDEVNVIMEIDLDGTRRSIIPKSSAEVYGKYGAFVNDTSIFLYDHSEIVNMDFDGNVKGKFPLSDPSFSGSAIKAFETSNDSLVMVYGTKPTIIKKSSFEGQVGNVKTFSNFFAKSAIKTETGEIIIAGSLNENIALMILDQNLDSIKTITYPQIKSSRVLDVIKLDDGKIAICGSMGAIRFEPNSSLVIIDDLSRIVGVTEEIQNVEVSLFPNPSASQVKITIDKNVNEINVVVTNSLGKIIETISSIPNGSSINTSAWLNGVYFLEISVNDLKTNKKLIIQH